MLAGLDPLVILYMPCDGTEDDLLHQLSRYQGELKRNSTKITKWEVVQALPAWLRGSAVPCGGSDGTGCNHLCPALGSPWPLLTKATLQPHRCQHPAPADPIQMKPQDPSKMTLNTSKDPSNMTLNTSIGEASSTSRGNLFQCLTICILKKFLAYVQSKSILFQFKTIAPCPITTGPGIKALSIFLINFYILKGHNKVSLEPSLLQP
ncbi:hypothetical protein QYF61_008561 [Mycteria americana]|uniref:Uncharacterized protein n=1 Tax=Mycteria americana TaxID=33587 RepID=A0AAN7S2U6_MYCAM|nr:hypothetical protein QYF61_008561 [Mycteria americana]